MGNAAQLLAYIDRYGMVGCNTCPYLRSIDEVGGSWQAAMELVEAKKLFYTKVFRHRTVYLSVELYGLLKCRQTPTEARRATWAYPARQLWEVLQAADRPLPARELKAESGFAPKTFSKAWQTMLEGMDATAWAPYKTLHPTWSSLLYTTSERWEKAAGLSLTPCTPDEAADRIRTLLRDTISPKDIETLLQQVQ